MSTETTKNLHLESLAMLFGAAYLLTGILGLIVLFFANDTLLALKLDPIEELILILNGIIFLRGYKNLHTEKESGEAFMFVATIIGILLGILALLNFLVVGILEKLLLDPVNGNIPSSLVAYLLNPTLVLGILIFIPHKRLKNQKTLA
jgi:hypothetical protein